jgi:hypothetical protein
VDKRYTRGTRPVKSCVCSAVEAILGPDMPSLGAGDPITFWALARNGEMTVPDLAVATRSSVELVNSRLDTLMKHGLARISDEAKGSYVAVMPSRRIVPEQVGA